MVSAMRHWAETLGVITRDAEGQWHVTELGDVLFHPQEGLDPYLEDPATLWLLHSALVAPNSRASTWHLVFSHFAQSLFARSQLIEWVSGYATQAGTKVSNNSIQRDVDVFLRTYVAPTSSKELYEDLWDCPLVELGLITLDSGYYQILQTTRDSLPAEVFTYALVSYWQTYFPEQRTLSFETLMYAPGSPGTTFKLFEGALVQRLRGLADLVPLVYDDTAGLRQVLSRVVITDIPLRPLLQHYYAR